MNLVLKPIVFAGILAAASMAAFSQGAPGGMGDHPMMGAGGPMHHHGMRHDCVDKLNPARAQAMTGRHHARLKDRLQLTPTQESAWTSYVAAMKPAADMTAAHAEVAELNKLPTPERIDKMKALHAQHVAAMTATMERSGEATKAFYAALTPEQKKVFDDSALRRPGRRGGMAHHRDGKAPVPPKQ